MTPGSIRQFSTARVAAGILSSTLFASAAMADVTISSDATENMSCAGGTCAQTSTSAVLNVGDLEALLASGNVTVTTTGSGVQADNIDVTTKLGWSANLLTLDAYQSLSVTAPVAVKGKTGLAILTNDGGSGGELAFSGKGHVTFKKLSGSLSINGKHYKLESSIATLAAAIKDNPSGYYALASDYDAGNDGTYGNSPIQTTFTGAFEGLGNRILNLAIFVPLAEYGSATGLFSYANATISDIGLVRASLKVHRVHGHFHSIALAGLLAGSAQGAISRVYVDGSVSLPSGIAGGGLVGGNAGTISESEASVTVHVAVGAGIFGGGLVGENSGQINVSYATGPVTGYVGSFIGGIVGYNDLGTIDNCYATGNVTRAEGSGGLIGANYGDVTTSYSTGLVKGTDFVGGLIADDGSNSGSLTDTYWDTTTSGITNLSQGAGYPANDPGITALTTEQFQSGLPAGFDPTVWGESADINGDLPYLLTNPPK